MSNETRPSSYIDWTSGTAPEVLQPPSGQQSTGWVANQKPPFQYMNWLFWLLDQWAQYLDFITDPPNTVSVGTATVTCAFPISAYFIDVTGAGRTANLPDNVSNVGYEVTVKNVAFGSGNVITVTPAGSDTIEGGTGGGSITLAAGEVARLRSAGNGNWYSTLA